MRSRDPRRRGAIAGLCCKEGWGERGTKHMKQIAQRIRNFLGEVRTEMDKVSWPNRPELIGSASVVFVSVVLLAAFIGSCDFLLSKLMQFLIQR